MPPDETTSTDTPAPASVETMAETSIVAEQSVVAENTVVTEPAPAVDAPVESTVAEAFTAVEQPAVVAQESVVSQSGDFALTPQTVQFEALRPEVIQEISPVEPAIEQVHVAPEPTQTPTQPAPEVARSTTQPQNIFRSLIAKGRATIQARKRKKLDRIMGLFTKQASIVNDDVEKLLHISDATACRYLGILEKENKIKQVGTAGRWVSYVKVG